MFWYQVIRTGRVSPFAADSPWAEFYYRIGHRRRTKKILNRCLRELLIRGALKISAIPGLNNLAHWAILFKKNNW